MSYKLKSIVVFFRIISDLLIVRNFGRIYIYIYIYIYIINSAKADLIRLALKKAL